MLLCNLVNMGCFLLTCLLMCSTLSDLYSWRKPTDVTCPLIKASVRLIDDRTILWHKVASIIHEIEVSFFYETKYYRLTYDFLFKVLIS